MHYELIKHKTFTYHPTYFADRGVTVVTVLCYGRSLVRCKLVSFEFFIDIKSFRSHFGLSVDTGSNRRAPGVFPGGKGGRCVRVIT